MNLIFNELSLLNKADNKFNAKKLMINLLQTCTEANQTGFRHLRVNDKFFQEFLFNGYTINDWLRDPSVSRDNKDLLLGFKRYPFIEENDEIIEDRFIQSYYYLVIPEVEKLHMKNPEGLAVAFLYNTLAISLKTNKVWDRTIIDLLEKIEGKNKTVYVKHISIPEHLNFHQSWIDSKRPINLVKSNIPSEDKTIKLTDDHGKDILKKFSEKLNRSAYIIGVINSLPFNPNEKHFIKEVHPDGLIEIVLTKTDKGYGLVIESTGRNLQETKAIADIIRKEFEK